MNWLTVVCAVGVGLCSIGAFTNFEAGNPVAGWWAISATGWAFASLMSTLDQ